MVTTNYLKIKLMDFLNLKNKKKINQILNKDRL